MSKRESELQRFEALRAELSARDVTVGAEHSKTSNNGSAYLSDHSSSGPVQLSPADKTKNMINGSESSKVIAPKSHDDAAFFAEFFLSASLAVCAKTAVAPLERLRLLFQTDAELIRRGRLHTPFSGFSDVLGTMLHNEGRVFCGHVSGGVSSSLGGGSSADARLTSLRGSSRWSVPRCVRSLFRGNWVTVCRYVPARGTEMAFKETFQGVFGFDRKRYAHWLHVIGNIISGGCAGSLTLLLVYPFDFVRTKMAVDMIAPPVMNASLVPTQAGGFEPYSVEGSRGGGSRAAPQQNMAASVSSRQHHSNTFANHVRYPCAGTTSAEGTAISSAPTISNGRPHVYRGMVHGFSLTLRAEGISGLYRGLLITCGATFIKFGLYYGIFDSLRSLVPQPPTAPARQQSTPDTSLRRDEDPNEAARRMDLRRWLMGSFFLGWVSTLTASLAAHPLDTLRRRMIVAGGGATPYRSATRCFLQVTKHEGVRALWRGASMHAVTAVAGACTLMTADALKPLLLGPMHMPLQK